MFLQFSTICLFFCAFSQITYSTPFFGNNENDPNVEHSALGNLLRYKAEMIDNVGNTLSKTFQRGFGIVSNNVDNLGRSVNTLIDATSRVIDDGMAAGRQYGSTIFQSAIFVPKTLANLVFASRRNAFININAAQDLSYVSGKPNYLFQFVDQNGHIIPITAATAHKLVPNLNV